MKHVSKSWLRMIEDNETIGTNKNGKQYYFINLILLLTSIIFSLFGTEGILRILRPSQLAINHIPCIYIPDQQLGYRYKPNAIGWLRINSEIDNLIIINSMGFHDIEHNNNNHDKTLYILAVGDSFTATGEVGISEGWTQTLQRELQVMGHSSVEVMNLGIDGTGTHEQLTLLKEYLPVFRPDFVILAFYKNDIEDILKKRRFRECYKGHILGFEDEEQRRKLKDFVDMSTERKYMSWLFNNVYLFRFISFSVNENSFWKSTYHTPIKIGITVENELDPPNINDLLQEFVVLSRQNHFKLLVVPVPAKSGLTDSLDTLKNNVSKEILTQLDVVDLYPNIQDMLVRDNKVNDNLFWKYDAHFNVYGNKIFGLAMAKAVNIYLEGNKLDE